MTRTSRRIRRRSGPERGPSSRSREARGGGPLPGVDYFVELTLAGSAFESSYSDGLGQACTWGGTVEPVAEGLLWSTEHASGGPCDRGVGVSGPVLWSMPDDQTLVLDFTDGFEFGTVQTFTRR